MRHNSASQATATPVARVVEPLIVPESLGVAAFFGACCWLLDAFLTTTLAGTSMQNALLPTGEALALRSAVAALVAVAAAITSSFLFRELRLRREDLYVPESTGELLETFTDSAFAVNDKGEITDANQAAAQLFSWPVNMFMPMKLDWLISEFIDDETNSFGSFVELVQRDPDCCRSGNSISIIGKALSGQKFVAELSCMPARDEERRYIVFVRERTETDTRRPVQAASVA
ncbi:MAG: PAS domain-containing protein [Pseudomonadota bacterium]